MHTALGEKLGDGATAGVHAWGPGQVVKLFKPGLPGRIVTHEARVTRAVHAASGLAPAVIDEITLNGRTGLVLTRLDGPTLMQLTKNATLSFAEAGAVLAACLHALHASPPPPDVPRLRAYAAQALRRAGEALPERVATGLMASLDRLSPPDGICHGDPNPGNVIMTANGPRLIDWIAAMRAPPAYDLASAHVLLTELAPFVADDPDRPRAINTALQSSYATLIGVSPDALSASVAPYLPIVRALTLLSGALGPLASRLTQRLAQDFPG